MSRIGFELDASLGPTYDLIQNLHLLYVGLVAAERLDFQLVLVFKSGPYSSEFLWPTDSNKVVAVNHYRGVGLGVVENARAGNPLYVSCGNESSPILGRPIGCRVSRAVHTHLQSPDEPLVAWGPVFSCELHVHWPNGRRIEVCA